MKNLYFESDTKDFTNVNNEAYLFYGKQNDNYSDFTILNDTSFYVLDIDKYQLKFVSTNFEKIIPIISGLGYGRFKVYSKNNTKKYEYKYFYGIENEIKDNSIKSVYISVLKKYSKYYFLFASKDVYKKIKINLVRIPNQYERKQFYNSYVDDSISVFLYRDSTYEIKNKYYSADKLIIENNGRKVYELQADYSLNIINPNIDFYYFKGFVYIIDKVESVMYKVSYDGNQRDTININLKHINNLFFDQVNETFYITTKKKLNNLFYIDLYQTNKKEISKIKTFVFNKNTNLKNIYGNKIYFPYKNKDDFCYYIYESEINDKDTSVIRFDSKIPHSKGLYLSGNHQNLLTAKNTIDYRLTDYKFLRKRMKRKLINKKKNYNNYENNTIKELLNSIVKSINNNEFEYVFCNYTMTKKDMYSQAIKELKANYVKYGKYFLEKELLKEKKIFERMLNNINNLNINELSPNVYELDFENYKFIVLKNKGQFYLSTTVWIGNMY